MTRTALYARYSSDKQREASIEDQMRLCAERAGREGWKVVRRYSDQAMSGASLLRPGIQALMQDAQERKFDVVLTESLDRISRDQEDIAGVYKRLRFAGVQIVTLSEGPVSELGTSGKPAVIDADRSAAGFWTSWPRGEALWEEAPSSVARGCFRRAQVSCRASTIASCCRPCWPW